MGFIDNIREEVERKPPKNSFTQADVIATGRYKSAQAGRILRSKVEDGELESDRFFVDGHWTNYFWEPKK